MYTITKKQRIYAELRVSGVGQVEAAIQAGYPEKTAPQAACRNDKNKNIVKLFKRKGFDPKMKNIASDKKVDEVKVAAKRIISSKDRGEMALNYLETVVLDDNEDPKLRSDCAKYLAKHSLEEKKSVSKSDKKQDTATEASNRFNISASPKNHKSLN